MASAANAQELIANARSAFSNKCIDVAAYTLYTSDFLQSFGEETLIWGQGWTFGKTLFLLLRYNALLYILFCGITGNTDDAPIWVLAIDNVASLVLPYLQLGIFLLCIHALLGATRAWKYVLVTAYLVMLAFSSTLMINHLAALGRGESVRTIFRVIGNYWVFARNLALLLLGATALYKRCYTHVKRTGLDRKRSLFAILRRDGLFYYLGILGTTLWACIFYTPGFPVRTRVTAYSGSLGRVIGAILANRMIMNLRKTVIGGDTQMEDVSTLWFAHDLQANCTVVRSDGGRETVKDNRVEETHPHV